jgi:hypothetical protein
MCDLIVTKILTGVTGADLWSSNYMDWTYWQYLVNGMHAVHVRFQDFHQRHDNSTDLHFCNLVSFIHVACVIDFSLCNYFPDVQLL